jgi:hypothetical protein
MEFDYNYHLSDLSLTPIIRHLDYRELTQLLWPIEARKQFAPLTNSTDMIAYLESLQVTSDGKICVGNNGSRIYADSDLDLIVSALRLGEEYTFNQKRKVTGEPVFNEHLLRLTEMIVSFGLNFHAVCMENNLQSMADIFLKPSVIAAAVLHDVLEDTDLTPFQLEGFLENQSSSAKHAVRIAFPLAKRDWRQYPGDAGDPHSRVEMKRLAEFFNFNALLSDDESLDGTRAILIKILDRYCNNYSDFVGNNPNGAYARKTKETFPVFFNHLRKALPEPTHQLIEDLKTCFFALVENNERQAKFYAPSSVRVSDGVEFSEFDPSLLLTLENVQSLLDETCRISSIFSEMPAEVKEEWAGLIKNVLEIVIRKQELGYIAKLIGSDHLEHPKKIISDISAENLHHVFPNALAKLIAHGDSLVIEQISEVSVNWLNEFEQAIKYLSFLASVINYHHSKLDSLALLIEKSYGQELSLRVDNPESMVIDLHRFVINHYKEAIAKEFNVKAPSVFWLSNAKFEIQDNSEFNPAYFIKEDKDPLAYYLSQIRMIEYVGIITTPRLNSQCAEKIHHVLNQRDEVLYHLLNKLRQMIPNLQGAEQVAIRTYSVPFDCWPTDGRPSDNDVEISERNLTISDLLSGNTNDVRLSYRSGSFCLASYYLIRSGSTELYLRIGEEYFFPVLLHNLAYNSWSLTDNDAMSALAQKMPRVLFGIHDSENYNGLSVTLADLTSIHLKDLNQNLTIHRILPYNAFDACYCLTGDKIPGVLLETSSKLSQFGLHVLHRVGDKMSHQYDDYGKQFYSQIIDSLLV